MPKGRRSTIASRNEGISGTGGSNITSQEVETAEIINDRLRQVGDVDVEVPSRTRGGIERVNVRFTEHPGRAEVGSVSGRTYNVDYENGTCDCMHYSMRQERCRHIDAVNSAIGQVTNTYNDQGLEDVIQQRTDIDSQEENQRSDIFLGQEDDNFFYLDNEDEFEQRLNGNETIEYEYDNVLNGSNITFGIELEFVGGDANAIARDLYNLGICAYDERVRYHAPSVEGKWKLERDGTVSDGRGGGEIVSPVLKDTPETWMNIETICDVAKRHGARIDSRCGGHVHVGMQPLDTARQRWRRFFKIISGYEECIYRAAGGDEGRIRSGHSSYATAFSDRAEYGAGAPIRMETERDVTDLAARVSNHNRYYGINLTNIVSSSKPDTVEFRYFNGALNPKQIQANVKLANGVTMAAEKARTKDVDSMELRVSDSFKRRGKLINQYDSTNNKSNKKLAEFVDIIFTRKKDKDALISVFSKNRWR